MQLYLTVLNEQVKLPDESPSIGIIICKSKDKTYVEYTLKQSNVPIGVATYKLSNSLPEEMKEMLPDIQGMVRREYLFHQKQFHLFQRGEICFQKFTAVSNHTPDGFYHQAEPARHRSASA